jgi:transcriptional regulator with XRE-family HTH domain
MKKLRKSLRLTQSQFARALGSVSFSTISRWEAGNPIRDEAQKETLEALQGLADNPEVDLEKLGSALLKIGAPATIFAAVAEGIEVPGVLGFKMHWYVTSRLNLRKNGVVDSWVLDDQGNRIA